MLESSQILHRADRADFGYVLIEINCRFPCVVQGAGDFAEPAQQKLESARHAQSYLDLRLHRRRRRRPFFGTGGGV